MDYGLIGICIISFIYTLIIYIKEKKDYLIFFTIISLISILIELNEIFYNNLIYTFGTFIFIILSMILIINITFKNYIKSKLKNKNNTLVFIILNSLTILISLRCINIINLNIKFNIILLIIFISYNIILIRKEGKKC